MLLPKAVNVMRLGSVCYGVFATLGGVAVLFPSAFSGEIASISFVVLAIATTVLGFTCLIVTYYRDRDYFPFIFGLGLGLSAISRGFAQIPEDKFAGSVFLQFASCIPPFAGALVLWHETRRLDRNRPTLVIAPHNHP